MRIKEQPDFLEVLNTFINEYMRFSAGLSENTVRLYKATFRLLLNYLYLNFLFLNISLNLLSIQL